METFIHRLQAFWTVAGKREKAVSVMSGFFYPRQKHKFLFDRFLLERRFYEADKTQQSAFYLSKIVFLLSNIVYVSMSYNSIGCITFAAGKIHKK
jgi:hypothetical protein